jgi:DUF1009 family protein
VLGLIAGRGRLPLDVARSARRRGRRVAAVAFRGLADAGLEREAAEVTWLHPGEVSAALAALHSGGVREAVLAGKVPKSALLAGAERLEIDARAAALLARLQDRRDDSILALVASVLEQEGIRLLPQADWVPELVAGEGVLGAVAPTPEQRAEVAFAWPIARALGAHDVGQTVVVRGRAVLALEAIEGTDAAIRRAGEFGPGACVVKLAKPHQDPRFDVPAVGPDTIAALADARAALLAVEAGRTLVLDRERFVSLADAHGIAVLGVRGPERPS